MNNFIIFEFLGFEYGKIDTRIESVASVLTKKRLVTEIMTSHSVSRSRASFTWIILSFSSSSASNMVKSTPRSSLYYFVHQRWDRWHRSCNVTLIDVMLTSWRIATLSHYYFYEGMSLRKAYPIVRIYFVTVFNTFIAVYRHANRWDELLHTGTRLTSHVTVVSSPVHKIFNKHWLWVSQTHESAGVTNRARVPQG